MMNGEWGAGWMGLGGFGMLLFWILILAGIVMLVRWLSGSGGSQDRSDTAPDAVELLRQRYARGEIDRDTYRRMLEDLTGSSGKA